MVAIRMDSMDWTIMCGRDTDTQRICGNNAVDLWNYVGLLVVGHGLYVGTVRGLVEVQFALQCHFVGLVCYLALAVVVVVDTVVPGRTWYWWHIIISYQYVVHKIACREIIAD